MGFLDRFRSKKEGDNGADLPVVEDDARRLRFSDDHPCPMCGTETSKMTAAGNGGAQASRMEPVRTTTSTSTNTKKPKKTKKMRPGMQRQTTAQTRYIEMLLSLDRIPRLHNIYASFFTWILLAGYIVFPATFTSVTDDSKLQKVADSSKVAEAVLGTFKNAPLLYIAAICCGIGVLGMLWLWKVHHNNYVWVINKIFLPGFMNSVAGLISTITNVYSAQGGQYSITAKSTMIVTSACSVVLALLFLLYNFWALARIKRKHERETRLVRQMNGQQTDGEDRSRADEGMVEKVKRKAHEPGLEPSSVV